LLARLRWIFWGVVLLVGIGAAIGLLLVGHGSGTTGSSAAPADSAPAATWGAGELRAPPIRLTDEHGAAVSLAALRGRPVIVTFIDPLCRDYCPIEARHLNDVVRSLPAASRPTILAVSVNVHGNAPAFLLQDERKWKAVPQWRWGVGSDAQLAAVWKRYHVAVLATTKKVAGVKVFSVAHTEAAYVLDADGYERALFLWPYKADGVARVLQQLG
jgi:cytochrome oxidase Cu insertion factor (SCO1/SenC/PrrC family)